MIVMLGPVASSGALAEPPEPVPEKRGSFFVVPIPTASPTLGAPGRNPPSTLGLALGYTESESWAAGADAKVHLGGDRFRRLGGYGQGELHYDLYPSGGDAEQTGSASPPRW